MEWLTKRDGKGHAYFDDDGALIRGANGTFHQKKDMTAQYIHQRFVALDKAIDCLAAYEDTGLTPEEIMALLNPPNPPLTLDEIKQMRGKPVWCPEAEAYGVIKLDKIGAWADKPFLKFFWLQSEDAPCGVDCEWDIEKRGLTLYRRKPEGTQHG